MQIPINLAIPWNFTAEDLLKAHEWIMQQTQEHPGDENIIAAFNVLQAIATAYAMETMTEEDD